MRSFLSKKRKKLVESKSFTQYLKYALGEVVLVVIGILIALSINNRNIDRMKAEKLDSIGQQIVNDLEADTADIRIILDSFSPIEETYLKVMGDSLSTDELKECLYCGSLVSFTIPFNPNDAGFNLLQSIDNKLISKKDSLILITKQFYSTTIPTLKLLDKAVKDDAINNIKEWKKTEDWFADWILGESIDDFINYMKTQNYRNQVANFYLLQFGNNLPFLEEYSRQAKELAAAWRKELEI